MIKYIHVQYMYAHAGLRWSCLTMQVPCYIHCNICNHTDHYTRSTCTEAHDKSGLNPMYVHVHIL